MAVLPVRLGQMTPEIAAQLPAVDLANKGSVTTEHLQAYQLGHLPAPQHELVEQMLRDPHHGMSLFGDLQRVRTALGGAPKPAAKARTVQGKQAGYEARETHELVALAGSKLKSAQEIIDEYDHKRQDYVDSAGVMEATAINNALRAEDKALAKVLDARGDHELAGQIREKMALANFLATSAAREDTYAGGRAQINSHRQK